VNYQVAINEVNRLVVVTAISIALFIKDNMKCAFGFIVEGVVVFSCKGLEVGDFAEQMRNEVM